ncbi:MAG: hypothetical protein ACOYMZ_03160 [Minisyncoccia bacterium]
MKFAFYSFISAALVVGWILFLIMRTIFADQNERWAQECTLE